MNGNSFAVSNLLVRPAQSKDFEGFSAACGGASCLTLETLRTMILKCMLPLILLVSGDFHVIP